MARKPKSELGDKAKLETLIQLPLLPDEVPAVKAFVLNIDGVLDKLDDAVSDGWSFAIERNTMRNNYGCLAKCQDPKSEDAGVGFYSNANTPFEALAVAVFKVFLDRPASIQELASRRGNDTSFS